MTAMTIARPTAGRTSDPPAEAPGTLFGVGPSFRLTGVFSPVAPNASATSSSSTEAAAAAVSRDFEGIGTAIRLRDNPDLDRYRPFVQAALEETRTQTQTQGLRAPPSAS